MPHQVHFVPEVETKESTINLQKPKIDSKLASNILHLFIHDLISGSANFRDRILKISCFASRNCDKLHEEKSDFFRTVPENALNPSACHSKFKAVSSSVLKNPPSFETEVCYHKFCELPPFDFSKPVFENKNLRGSVMEYLETLFKDRKDVAAVPVCPVEIIPSIEALHQTSKTDPFKETKMKYDGKVCEESHPIAASKKLDTHPGKPPYAGTSFINNPQLYSMGRGPFQKEDVSLLKSSNPSLPKTMDVTPTLIKTAYSDLQEFHSLIHMIAPNYSCESSENLMDLEVFYNLATEILKQVPTTV